MENFSAIHVTFGLSLNVDKRLKRYCQFPRIATGRRFLCFIYTSRLHEVAFGTQWSRDRMNQRVHKEVLSHSAVQSWSLSQISPKTTNKWRRKSEESRANWSKQMERHKRVALALSRESIDATNDRIRMIRESIVANNDRIRIIWVSNYSLYGGM